jgi:hypothetical protein
MNGASRLLAEARGNRRLRWGLWAILGLLWAYGVLALRDEAAVRANTYIVAARRAAQQETEAQSTGWMSRAEAARVLKAQLESRLWQANSIGLAQAALQDWLSRALQAAKAVRPAVTVTASDTPVAEGAPGGGRGQVEDLWKVSAKLEFAFAPESLMAVLEALEGSQHTVAVESLEVRTEPTPRAEIGVVAYFQRPRPGPRAVPESAPGTAQQ